MKLLSKFLDAFDGTSREAKTDGGNEEATAGETPAASEQRQPQSSLFECPECDKTFVAVEKATCSSCGADVREISATLTAANRQ